MIRHNAGRDIASRQPPPRAIVGVTPYAEVGTMCDNTLSEWVKWAGIADPAVVWVTSGRKGTNRWQWPTD